MTKITELKRALKSFIFITTLIFTFSATAQVGIGTTTPTAQLTVTEDGIFNESGGDNDFRVESDGNINMFNIDAQHNVFGFNALPNTTTLIGTHISQIYDPFEIGNDGATGYQIAIGYYFNSDPLILPETDFYGYNGAYDFVNQNAWYEVNSYNYYVISNRETKRDIYNINDHLEIENYVMADIDKIKPSFYKYHNDLDQLVTGQENKYRPQMRLGVITDEAPDYVTDAVNSKVSLYSIATMSLVGVKHNRSKIKEIEEKLELTKISDFGSIVLNGKDIEVMFDSSFSKNLHGSPIITVTSNNPEINVSISRKTKRGFLIVASEEVTNLSVDWIAMGKTNITNDNFETASNRSMDPHLKSQLEIPLSEKQKIIEFQKNNKPSRDIKEVDDGK